MNDRKILIVRDGTHNTFTTRGIGNERLLKESLQREGVDASLTCASAALFTAQRGGYSIAIVPIRAYKREEDRYDPYYVALAHSLKTYCDEVWGIINGDCRDVQEYGNHGLRLDKAYHLSAPVVVDTIPQDAKRWFDERNGGKDAAVSIPAEEK